MHEGWLDQATAVSSLGICMRRWYKCGVNLASDLLLPFFAVLYMQNFAPNSKALADLKRLMSFTGLQCGHPAGGIRRLQVLKHLGVFTCCPFREKLAGAQGFFGAIQLYFMRYRCSSNDCLSEEKTGLSLKSQDRVRALLIVCVRLECSKLGHSLSQP